MQLFIFHLALADLLVGIGYMLPEWIHSLKRNRYDGPAWLCGYIAVVGLQRDSSMDRVIYDILYIIYLYIIMILKPTPECQSKFNRPGKAVRFSIGSQASCPISEAITASNNKNIKFEIRNNKLDQLQGTRMSAKMAANGIRTHARTANGIRTQPMFKV